MVKVYKHLFIEDLVRIQIWNDKILKLYKNKYLIKGFNKTN